MMKNIILKMLVVCVTFLFISTVTAASTIKADSVLQEKKEISMFFEGKNKSPSCFRFFIELYINFLLAWGIYTFYFMETHNLPETYFWTIVSMIIQFFPALIAAIQVTIG